VPLGFLLLMRKAAWQARWFDLALPVGLGLLAAALLWGVYIAEWEFTAVRDFLDWVTNGKLYPTTQDTRLICIYGVPALLCYLFVERPLRFGLAVGALLVVSALPDIVEGTKIHQERSYFGVMTVHRELRRHGDGRQEEYHRLIHGSTVHGEQCMDPKRRAEPLTYYHHDGPIGHLLTAYPEATRNYAVIGLGTGTMAAYGGPGRKVTFYEIDRHVRDIARNPAYFSYLTDYEERRGGEETEIIMGDARLQMEKAQLDDKYSMIVVDAFSSDAIPVHLLTLEALRIYLSNLTEDGFVVFHISNRYLDLEPVLGNLAKAAGVASLVGKSWGGSDGDRYPSTWVTMARKKEYLERLSLIDSWDATRLLACWPVPALSSHAAALNAICYRLAWEPPKESSKVGVWTDNYSNVLSVFWWKQ